MKAIVIREFGGVDKLNYEEIDTPRPGAGQVLVRIRAAGVNHLDHDVREGISGAPIALPHVPGIEGAGDVAALGEGVSSVKEGQRVSVNLIKSCGHCRNCILGDDNLCMNAEALGLSMWGPYSEFLLCHERQLVPIPDNLSYETAAASHLCFSTAWHMLVTLGRVTAGMKVMINAAGSGVGTSAIQIAKLHGAHVVATAGSDEKLTRAKALGADETINYTSQNMVESALEMTGGVGPDVVVECVGGKVLSDSIHAVRRGGMVVTCGAHAGEKIELDVIELFRKHLRFQGSVLATRSETEHVLGLVADGKLNPVIHAVMPLAEAREAATLTDNREFFGKMILAP